MIHMDSAVQEVLDFINIKLNFWDNLNEQYRGRLNYYFLLARNTFSMLNC